ncbi:hypothetical protein C0Q70_09569 [Pomacea canaliculata]|uniref:CARD domain-containing protein n=2 Tax=Pomacea canaliculata TaxID=400727 RepID=A0A2T7PA56_POMCA|nr:uncharacterized protein LOC112565015 isoform X1 [Pomacea canaliculata]XP_025096011.1 uncharacterized protein LOC112565015 isoform X1 [Pomacea canaliculata]XP_025096012.1 uncharacterized protein LOC112565015 isoform X1 [Pomacea canaliculata]XP_025096013.1 uncharacterized protein LOC112565015 isoform X1 [Pomacea canaliculata]PVD30305.1 hypothetical protein C0Q70_09569 [Pomacea canaliculata]
MSEDINHRFPRGKVTSEQERCLQKNNMFLADNIECTDIVTLLYSRLILDDNDKQKILGTDGQRLPRKEQSLRLLDVITMRSPAGFEAFLKALDDTGHLAAAGRIRQTLHNLSEELVGRPREYDHSTYVKQITSTSSDSESVEDDARGRETFKQEVFGLCDRVDKIEKHLDVLSYRMTQIDGGQKEEVSRLRQKLSEASNEIKKLRRENENLNCLVAEKSEQLRQASDKIEALEKQLKVMENDNTNLLNRVVEQSQELQRMRLQAQQAREQITDLQSEVDKQNQQQSLHKRELDSLRKRSEAENKKVAELQEFKKKNEQVMQTVVRQFMSMQNEIQQLKDQRPVTDNATGGRQGKSAVSKLNHLEQGDNSVAGRCAVAKQQLFNFDRPSTKQGNKPKPQPFYKPRK